MAEVNLGRASLSVTADLSGFTSALDNAAKQTDKLSTANNIVVASSNNVTTSLDHQTKSVQELQDAAVSNSILVKNMNLTAQATKLATDNLVLLDGATLLYLKDEKELEFQQAKLNTGFKELESNLLKNDAAFKNNSLLIELNTQKQRNLALENKASMAAMLALDDQAIGYAANQKTLSTELDIATRKLDLQARQMNIDTGATKALHDELVKLEEQEKALAAQEDKVKGINQPIAVIEPPAKINTNTAEFVKGQMNLKSETNMATKALELQARQMNIDSGATKKLHDEMKKLEAQEKKIIDLENKAKGIIPPPLVIKPPTIPVEKAKTTSKAAGGGMKLTDMLGIGFFTAAFTKVFDGAMALVKSIVTGVIDLGAKIIESGSKFQELDRRLSSMTGFSGLATGLQTIMNSGPSASFTALGESATRLAALKFRPDAIQGLIKNFNSLGVALGNPEKILALITDKIADMVSEGGATMAALGKLSDEGIQVFEALAKSMGVSVDEAKRRVTQGLVTVTQATQAISDAANMPAMLAAAEASANSFSGIWNRVTNNIEVLFQNIGVSILKGFGLVSLNTSITNFFESLSNKAAEFAPMLEKFGAVIAMISAKVLDSIESFLTQWVVTTEKMTVEEMLGEIEIVAERIVKSAIDFITELKPFVEILVAGAKQMLVIADGLGNMKKNMELDAKAAGDLFKPKPVDNLDNISILELMDLQNDVMANIDQIDQQIQDVMDTTFSGTGGSFMTPLEEAIEASRIAIEEQLAKINDMPLIQEAPRWQKFLDENLSPLQTYQNEIEKLNMLLADGSAQGFQAFAIGSAGALAKLKSSMGVSAEPKFASAITKGSAEDFKATIDMQSKTKDVQQEIKELMALANQLQQEQLEAQQATARAILAQRPAQVLAFCGPV